MYLSNIAKCTCPNQFGKEDVKCICSNLKMYLSNIAKCICPNQFGKEDALADDSQQRLSLTSLLPISRPLNFISLPLYHTSAYDIIIIFPDPLLPYFLLFISPLIIQFSYKKSSHLISSQPNIHIPLSQTNLFTFLSSANWFSFNARASKLPLSKYICPY